MIIRTDLNRLSSLSGRLKRLESDLSQITSQLTRTSRVTVQSVKYRTSDYQIRKACDNVISALDRVNKASINVCDRIYNQSMVIGNAVGTYRQYDKLDKVNKSALYNAGSSLRNFFGGVGIVGYTNIIPSTLFRMLQTGFRTGNVIIGQNFDSLDEMYDDYLAAKTDYDPGKRFASLGLKTRDASVVSNFSWLQGSTYNTRRRFGKTIESTGETVTGAPKSATKKSLKDYLGFKPWAGGMQGYVGRADITATEGIVTSVAAMELLSGFTTGEVNFGLWDGKGLGINGMVKGNAVKAQDRTTIDLGHGISLFSDVSGGLGNASLGLGAGAGKNMFTNEDGTKESGLFKLYGSALASIAEGSAKVGITVAGVDISLIGKGYLGGIGYEGEASVTTEGVTAYIGAVSGVGGTVGFDVNWQKAEWIDEGIETVKEFAGDKFNDAKEFAGEKFNEAKEFAGEKFNDAKEFAGEKFNEAKEFAGEKYNDAKDFADGVKEKAGEVFADAKEFGSDLKDAAGDFASDVKNAANDLKNDVKDAWNNFVN